MKIIIWWRESYKTSMRIRKDSRGMVLASPTASQARGLASDFKAWQDKTGENIKFQQIVDQTGTFTYNAAQVILDLKPLCKNEYTINGTQKFFARPFNFIPPLEEDYGYVSYDEETLFTNIPLKETIDNTIDQIHVQKKLAPICTKLMIKRLLLKLATECKFTFLNSF